LRNLQAFAQSPVGKKASGLVPQLLEAGAKIGAARVAEHQAELTQMLMQQAGNPPATP
jgi:hypothetical protein